LIKTINKGFDFSLATGQTSKKGDILPKAVSTWTGLSQEDARKLLAVHGPNELAQESKKSFWQQNYKTISEPMVLLLLASAFIYLLIGDFSEGMLLLFSVVLLIALTTYQERKSQKALDALRDLSSPRSLVLRSGIKQRVAANQLVPGDLIYLHEGDRIPADGAILESNHLTVDESLLSGESFPVEKEPIHPALDLSKESNQVYSGTLVVSGSAFVEVTHTGSRTSFGKIGLSLKSIEDNELTLATELRHVVKVFAWSGLALSAFIVLLYGLKKQDWTQALLIGIATEMTLLPEEFPIILTVFMAIGAWRLSKVQVLVRKPIAIERLGAITALCVDKTGTLTENVMQIKKIQTASNTAETDFLNLSREALELISTAQLASAVNPFDPMEKAIESLATKQHITVSKNLS
jgi:Ca2+-transporting ATPase